MAPAIDAIKNFNLLTAEIER